MSEDAKYETLVNILDRICDEAPPRFKRYHPDPASLDAVNQARSRAYIHLYLKVRYGVLDFEERESCITDESGDGGLDAFYIDERSRTVDLIQSKFRVTPENFRDKTIALSELFGMEVKRITTGELTSEAGRPYNHKIKAFQQRLRDIPDIGRYDHNVILLANVKNKSDEALRRLTGGFPTEVFDFRRTYDELVFPVVSGTYYNQPTLCITLDLTKKESSSSRVKYDVETAFAECSISLLFVPTLEIGRILYQYKNAILKYNPRAYLELRANEVNQAIADTIEKKVTNEFALFNNGITVLSDETHFSEDVGSKGRAQLVLSNPQIINGGQTAFTLSRLYERMIKGELPTDIFEDKEVLLKVITFDETAPNTGPERLQLIEDISYATNSQTRVTEADRRANDKIQIELQSELFERFGYYYERKRGEFADGIREQYVRRSQLINREDFFRVCMACDMRPAQARRTGSEAMFREGSFKSTLNDPSRVDEYMFAFRCFELLNALERECRVDEEDPFGTQMYGNALRYGKLAVVAVCAPEYSTRMLAEAPEVIKEKLAQWLEFEEYAIKQHGNRDYFSEWRDPETGDVRQVLNMDGYYKGRTLNGNLADYFFAIGETEAE